MAIYLADECFSGPLLRALRSAGFDIIRSADTLPSAPDEQVLDLAFKLGRVLLTEDNDFGDLAVRLGMPAIGIVRVDLKNLNRAAQIVRIIAAMTALGERAVGAMVTIEPTRTRVRTLQTSAP